MRGRVGVAAEANRKRGKEGSRDQSLQKIHHGVKFAVLTSLHSPAECSRPRGRRPRPEANVVPRQKSRVLHIVISRLRRGK